MKLVELGDVATIERKGVDPSSLTPETIYLGLEHIERGGRIIGRDTVGASDLASTKFVFSNEHVLFGKLRPNLGKVSRPDFSGVCSTDILPIRPGRDLDRDYLAHYLAQPAMVNFAASRTSGANLPRLSPTVLARFPLPLPPLGEQRRIAAILDRADAIRAKRRQVLTYLDSLVNAIYRDMFEGHAYARQPLERLIAEQQIGLVRAAADQRPEHPYDYVKMDAITRQGQVDLSSLARVQASASEKAKFSLMDGDLLLNTRNTRELVGKSAVYRGEPRLYNNNLMRIRLREGIGVDYIHRYLWSREGQRQLESRKSGTTSVFAIYARSLMSLEVPVPPMHQQVRFGTLVAAANAQRASVQRSLAADDELFASLQSRAFRGEL